MRSYFLIGDDYSSVTAVPNLPLLFPRDTEKKCFTNLECGDDLLYNGHIMKQYGKSKPTNMRGRYADI